MPEPYLYQYHISDNAIQTQCLASGSPEEDGNFYKSVKWSPDGTSLAAHAEDNALHIYSVCDVVDSIAQGSVSADTERRQISPTAAIPHAERFIDFSWYPYMHHTTPSTCCLVESTRDHPLHLRDTNYGSVRAHYAAYDSKEVLMTANCTLFSPDGSRIYAGYQRSIGVFDTQRAGLPISLDSTSPTRRSKDGVRGIISCLAFSPTSQVLACGSFSGQISLRSADSTTASVWPVPAEYAGQGVAHLQWSPNGMLLWAAPRQSRHIVAWDVRDLRGPYAVVERPATTQQRMAFDFDSMGRFLVAGQMDGSLAFHDICGLDSAEDRDVARVPAHDDLVAGVACHPHYALLATAAGQRRFSDYGDDEPVAAGRSMCSPSLKLWSLGAQYFEREIQA